MSEKRSLSLADSEELNSIVDWKTGKKNKFSDPSFSTVRYFPLTFEPLVLALVLLESLLHDPLQLDGVDGAVLAVDERPQLSRVPLAHPGRVAAEVAAGDVAAGIGGGGGLGGQARVAQVQGGFGALDLLFVRHVLILTRVANGNGTRAGICGPRSSQLDR